MQTPLLYIISLLIPLVSTYHHLIGYQAIITVPIADLIGEPFHGTKKELLDHYQNLELAPTKSPHARIHQALFNEHITVKKEKNEQVCVEITNAFVTNNKDQHHATYWTLKTNITPLKTVQKGNAMDAIPPALSYKNNHQEAQKPVRIGTLTTSWYIPESARCFSAGTRFVIIDKPDEHYSKKMLNVAIFNPLTSTIEYHPIANTMIKEHTNKIIAHDTLRNDFVTLLRSWIHNPNFHIPYVWGGASIILNNTIISTVTAGLDCSGTILRAAQIVGIPYYYKNSSTALKHRKKITNLNNLAHGDLIYIPGHIMIVSDINNGLIIEARWYDQDNYGKLQEIPLSKEFEQITSYQELIDAIHEKRPFYRLDMKGNRKECITQCALLSLTDH